MTTDPRQWPAVTQHPCCRSVSKTGGVRGLAEWKKKKDTHAAMLLSRNRGGGGAPTDFIEGKWSPVSGGTFWACWIKARSSRVERGSEAGWQQL
jgi:hypothetical protein